MRTAALLLVAGFSLVLAAALLVAFQSVPDAMTTDTYSCDLADDDAKVRFLRRYLHPRSAIDATEFHIWFRASSGFVPGPSDWEMNVVMKVPRDDLPRYRVGSNQAGPIDLRWGYHLLPREPRWAIQSQPVVYRRGNSIVALFEAERIVFERHTTSP